MSGGEQQMVAIGRGLMSNPKCLMLDEPSLGLAPIVVDTLADTIKELHAAGITILLVEQRVDLALRLADRGYVLETGSIVLEDKAAALLADPRVQQAYLGT
jgi:branched-chain amino acid transport system ATP-binding protein